MKKEEFSEERLNALVDGELDPEEKGRFYSESSRSPELDQRLCQQRKLKELVVHAYEDLPAPTRSRISTLSRSSVFSWTIAAGILIVFGLAGGLLVHNRLEHGSFLGGDAVVNVSNYLLHVTSSDPEQMLAALRHAEELLEQAPDGELRQVEIIANERGLDLVRSDVTPFAREISLLQDRDVVFYACSRTIERLEQQGVEVRLVPHINAEYTALDRVVSRMQEGWKYEKI